MREHAWNGAVGVRVLVVEEERQHDIILRNESKMEACATLFTRAAGYARNGVTQTPVWIQVVIQGRQKAMATNAPPKPTAAAQRWRRYSEYRKKRQQRCGSR